MNTYRDPGRWQMGDREASNRHVRRMSNLTAAALIAGTGTAAAALATHQFGTTSNSSTGTTATGTSNHSATGATTNAPQVGQSVVTSGGSGVTITTTKKVVNGHVVVTHVRHVAHYVDN